MRERSSFIGFEKPSAIRAAQDDKEAAQAGCLFCNLTNGEISESLLQPNVPEPAFDRGQ
jgi:hypothetical protein